MVHVSRLKKCVLKSTVDPSAVSAAPSTSPPAELLYSYETPVAESTPTSTDLPFLPPTHTSIRIPSEPRRPRRAAAPKKAPIEASTESTTESSSAPLVEEKTDTPASPPSSNIPIPAPPSLILSQTSPLFQWTRLKHLLEFSVVSDFPFVLTTMSRSSSVNQFSLLSLSTLLPIASANG
jgi:hypothetical protein